MGAVVFLLLCLSAIGAFAQELSLPPKPDPDARVIYQEQILDLAGECEAAGLADLAFELRGVAVEGEDAVDPILGAVTNAYPRLGCPRCKDGNPAGPCPSCTGAPACICCKGHIRCCTYTRGVPKTCRTKCVYDTWYCPLDPMPGGY